MRLRTTYLNERIELLDGVYGEGRAAELATATRMYNRTIGPVTAVYLVRPEARDLSLYSASCEHAPVERLLTDLQVRAGPYAGFVPGGGKGATPLHPVLGAFGEMTERLLAILHFTSLYERVCYGTHAELVRAGRRALGPSDVPLFAREQYARRDFPYVPFADDTWLGWVEGADLLTGEPVWVPAQLVLMYYKPHPAEQPIGYATTAGLAYQTSRRQAILHGLAEVVERDALNLRWYARLPPARVRVDLRQVLAGSLGVPHPRVETPHLTVGIYLLTLDSPIPVLAAVGIDRSRTDRAFLGGTGAAGTRAEALGQALFELGQCQTGFHFDDPFGRMPIYPDSDLSEVVEFFDAPLYYGYAHNLPRTRWFTAAAQQVDWEDVGEDADAAEAEARLLAWLGRAGLRPVVLDFDDVCPPGMAITKVFVPGLTHACPPGNPMLGHPRFSELPHRLGLADRRLTFADLNPDPIPFA